MFQVIITIISALGAFCAFYLLGSRHQESKDAQELDEYRAKAESQISQALREKAEALATVKKEKAESELLKKAVDIVVEPPIQSNTEQLKEKIEKADTEEDLKEAMELLKADSIRRAEEVAKRYE